MSAWGQVRPAGYAAAAADTVRQALADAAAWRSMSAGGFPARYAALRVRLGGDRP